MRVEVLCGREALEIEVPDRALVLEPQKLPPLDDPKAAVARALAEPLGTPPLARLARGRRDACVVISDITRPVPNKVILPPLLATLEEAGIPREKITILIATGMHRPNEGPELESMVGPEIMKNHRIVNHFCRRKEDVERVAEIDGAPIEINRHYLAADLKILTGLIEPHMYAGYSGGRKSILPGISSFTTMTFMHSFAMIDHPKVTNAVLDGNPFHEAGQKVAAAVGVDFILNAVINKQRQMVGVYAGDLTRAHRAGCGFVEKQTVHRLKERVDLVITSAGGAPLDATFYQVSKGLIMARNMLKPGGAVLVTCECAEGLGGPEYCQLIREERLPREFFDHYSKKENFVIDQWCLQTTFQALDHAGEAHCYSPGLSAADLGAMGVNKVEDLQGTVDRLSQGAESIAVVPEGPYVVGLVEG